MKNTDQIRHKEPPAHCSYCGRPLKKADRFCLWCTHEQEPKKPYPLRRHKHRLGAICLLVLTVLLAAILTVTEKYIVPTLDKSAESDVLPALPDASSTAVSTAVSTFAESTAEISSEAPSDSTATPETVISTDPPVHAEPASPDEITQELLLLIGSEVPYCPNPAGVIFFTDEYRVEPLYTAAEAAAELAAILRSKAYDWNRRYHVEPYWSLDRSNIKTEYSGAYTITLYFGSPAQRESNGVFDSDVCINEVKVRLREIDSGLRPLVNLDSDYGSISFDFPLAVIVDIEKVQSNDVQPQIVYELVQQIENIASQYETVNAYMLYYAGRRAGENTYVFVLTIRDNSIG